MSFFFHWSALSKYYYLPIIKFANFNYTVRFLLKNMYSHVTTTITQEVPLCLFVPLCPSLSCSPVATGLISVTVGLPFLEFLMSGIDHVSVFCICSLIGMQSLRFTVLCVLIIHVFQPASGTPLYQCTTICFSICQWMDIWVLSRGPSTLEGLGLTWNEPGLSDFSPGFLCS